MKKILFAMLLMVSAFAHADMTIVTPGWNAWLIAVVPEIEKQLGEKIQPEIIQGARDIPAGNKWHEKYRFEPNMLFFSNGGQAEAYLLEDVKYNFKDYEPILAQNQSIIVAHNKNQSIYTNQIKFGAGSGMNPDAMALTMLVCGPLPSMQAYLDCYKQHMNYVKGMKNPEIATAYTREEMNAIRENPADYKVKFQTLAFNETLFSAGLFDIKNGKIMPDPNFPVGERSFPEAYKAKWGKLPSGDFYDAWLLDKNYRDVLQKVIWVNKNDPNKAKLIAAVRKMVADPESQKNIAEKVGAYPWWVGDEVRTAQTALEKQLTMKTLKNLVWWTNEAYQINAILKPEIVSKAK